MSIPNSIDMSPALTGQGARAEIVFIDSGIAGYRQLLAGLRPGLEVQLLDATQDGLTQIAAALAGRSGVGALHIVSHGAEGMLALGSATLSSATLPAYAAQLAAIGAALGPDADILLYGCDTGRGTPGATFLGQLSERTGAGIAASTDSTGASDLGGNWILERHVGAIDAAGAFGAAGPAFEALLGMPADQDFNALSNDNLATGVDNARTLGSFVFEGNRTDAPGQDGGNPSSTHALTTLVYDSATLNLSIGSGQAIGLNYGQLYTTTWWQFRTVSAADNFKLASLQLESSSNGWDDIITISGYDDGGQAVSATVNLTVGGTYGSISYTKGAAVGGTLTFGAGWGDIDTVRFASEAGHPYGSQLWLDNIDVSPPPATISSATYDATSGVLTVSATGLTAGDSIDAGKLTLTGQGANSATLTSGTVTAGASTFAVTLNAADKLAVNGLLNKNLSAADDGTTFNLAAGAGWNASTGAAADASNPVSVSNVVAPSISSATYNAATHVLTVSGANLVGSAGAANDVTVAKLTLTGEGALSRTLTGASVDVASATSFSLTLAGADRNFVEMMFNKNGTAATDGVTAYNLSAADDWNTSFTGGNTALATAALTVSNVATPSITLAAYDGATGTLVVTGTGLTHAAGIGNDIVAAKLSFTGQGGASYALVGSPNVDIASGTGFTLVLDATDKAAVNLLLNKAGTQSNGGTTYNLAFAEDWAAGAAAAVVVADLTGNPIVVSNADSTPPTATIAMSDSAVIIGETALVTITFSEPVSGFTNADLSVGNGVLSAVATSDGGVTWTATFTPDPNVSDASNLITLASGALTDLAGNPNAASTDSANYSVNTVRPGASVTLADSALAIGETSLVTIVFSEQVSGLSLAALAAPNGVLSALATADNITWTAVFTPDAGIADTSNLLTLDLSGVVNAAGNAGAASVSSGNYAIDTQRPGATITLNDSALKIGDVPTVTVTFSEAVTGFTNAGLTADNGVLGAFTSSDGGVTWSASFTPAAGIEDAGNRITLDNTALADAFGNAGLGTTQSANYTLDTLAPQATLVVASSALAAGASTTVSIAFDAPVSGFSNADLSVANGSLSAVSSADGGLTWSATLTPASAVEDGSNVITLDLSGVQDAAGNSGSGTASSNNYAVSTTIPSASIVVADNALLAGETSAVTIAFSQAVAGLGVADFSVGNGTLSGLATADGGLTWTALLTPAAGVDDPTNLITLDNTGFASAGGSAGVGTTLSNNYALAMIRPTAVVVVAQANLGPGQSSLVTITFSEPVTGFSSADLSCGGATVGPVTTLDGISWSATLTPAADTMASSAVTLDTAGLLDLSGNPGNTLAVSNAYQVNTRASGPPVVIIDGAPTTTVLGHDPVTGLDTTSIYVPIILALDPEPGGQAGVAEIPVGPQLVVGLPVGTGLLADGPGTLLSIAQAQTDLVRRIEDKTVAGSDERAALTEQGRSFLDALAPGAVLETRTLALAASSIAAATAAIAIAGSHSGSAIGLVIDTSGLPGNIVLQLDNIDFAAVIGAATVRGGAGVNHVAGNDAPQNLLLGPENDLLFGGGGNDLLAGGAGSDLLDGGAGDDVLQGGRSDRGGWQFFMDSAGIVSAQHATALFDPGASETVQLAELDGDASGLAFLHAAPGQLADLALLYHAAFQRAPDLGGLAYYARDGVGAAAVMNDFMASAEWTGAGNSGLSDSAFVQKMYQQVLGRGAEDAGLAYWVGQLGAPGGSGLARAGMLTALALSPEHKSHITGTDGIVIGAGALAQEAGWFAGSGDDRLRGGPGNDLLVGGDGVDSALYDGKQSDYRFLLTSDGRIEVEHKADGERDTLIGIEQAAFSNGTVELAFTRADAAALRTLGMIYQTVLDRPAEPGALAWWLGQHQDAPQLARSFAGSAEFATRYGALDDAHFVSAMLANSELATTAGGGQAAWENYLGSHTRAELIAAWVADPLVLAGQFGAHGLWLL